MEKFSRERSANRKAFAERKQNLDEKIHILEETIANREAFETSGGKLVGYNTSPRSDSTRFEESALNSSKF